MVFAAPLTAHANGFSQWLMTKFDERRIYSAVNRRARLMPCQNLSVGQEPDPPNYSFRCHHQSLIANCYSLPSRPADLPTSRFADNFGSAGASPS